MRAHPYRLIGERLGRSLRQALESVITNWVVDWLPDATTYSIESLVPLFDFCQERQSTETEFLVNWVDENWCAVLKPAEIVSLGGVLIGASDEELEEMASSALLRDVTRQALADLAQRILSGTQAAYDSVPFFVTDNPLPKRADLRGSGALVIGFRVASLSFDYVVSPMTVERYIDVLNTPHQESRRKLIPLKTALADQKLNARVSLGYATLSLADLATMRIGDVVTMDKHINEPAAMRLGLNSGACEGFIGTKENALAFRISRAKDQHSE